MAAIEIESYTARLNPLLVAGLSPKSLAAEQYRQLRTRLAHAENAHAAPHRLVTKPAEGRGQVDHLGQPRADDRAGASAARRARRSGSCGSRRCSTCSGCRRPRSRRLLVGAAELNDVMKFLPDHNLTVITAGTAPTNPAELLGSTAMRRLLDQLRTR